MRRQIASRDADVHARALLVVRARVAVERELHLIVPEAGGGRLQAVALTPDAGVDYLLTVRVLVPTRRRRGRRGGAAGAHAV